MPQHTRPRAGLRARTAGAALTLAALGLGSLALAAGGARAATPASRVTLAGTHPSWAVAAHQVGRQAVTSGTVRARVYLAPRDAAGLAATAMAVSTPGTPGYRHFLRPAQVQARYGTTAAQLSAIRGWLRSSGLRVTSVRNHVAGGYVAVSGPVAAASRAFGVRFARYRLPGQGIVRAPQHAASVPDRVAAGVLEVTGLSTARQMMHPLSAPAAGVSSPVRGLPPPGPNYWVARPCGTYYNQKTALAKPPAYGRHWPWAVCGYTPRQIRSVYGVSASGATGAGQTVAIVDAYASPTMPGDASKYARATGDRPFSPGQYRQYLPHRFTGAGPDVCGAQGWYGEQTLDIESVHGMAPRAKIRYVAAASCYDEDLASALSLIVNNHLASIVSNSWGGTEDSDLPFSPIYHQIFAAGAAEGIEFMFSSGDSGYEAPSQDPGFSDRIQVDYPTSDPLVTSVGGTSLAIGKSRGYLFETSWGTLLNPLAAGGRKWQYPLPGPYPQGFNGGSGGGTSTMFAQPAYQAGVVPASLSQRLPSGRTAEHPMRVVPDVSALADPATGILVGQTVREPHGHRYGFALSRIGGTSVACPVLAGIEADAQQVAGRALGFANPLIYQRYTAGDGSFRDVTDHPLGPGRLAQVRANYTDPATRGKPILYYLRTLGIDGEGAAALHAVKGFDDATGVGSPWHYIASFRPA
ncbi:MAG TPA: S53 family peptidase [Streptosporangiaceae bacterium]|nr:S53 family peptidase [Streptosporangiaceae bacterium]